MEDDELYRKYLESVFYLVDENYYYNVKTHEIIPEHLALDNVSKYDLNCIVRHMYEICDIFGRPINNTISNETFLASLDDYFLTKSNDIPKTFKVYDSCGNVIATYNEEPDKSSIYFPYLAQENNRVVLKDKAGGLNVTYFDRKNKIFKVGFKDKEEIDKVLQKFNILKSFMQELKSKKKLNNLYYNDNFLMIKADFQDASLAVCLIYSGNSDYKSRIINYDISGFEAKFNNERCLIYTDSLSYYDIKGTKLVEYKYVDKDEVIAIDYTLTNLLTRGKLYLKLEKDNVVGYLHNKKYIIIGSYKCGRLLIKNEQGFYGYLDEDGNEVIKPQFTSASPFERGWAVVDGREVDTNGKFYEYISPFKVLKNNDLYVSFHNVSYDYSGSISENAFVEGLWSYDYSKYLKIIPPKNNPFKKVIYYYVDYKTRKVVPTDYQPLRQYENFMFLLITKNFYWQDGCYLFDKRDNSYTWFASKDTEIEFYDNYLICNSVTYYVTDQIICLGDFNIQHRKLKKDCILLSKEEYLNKYQNFIRRNKLETSEAINQKISEYQQYTLKIAECQRQIDELEIEKRKLTFKMKALPNHTLEIPNNFYYEENGIKYISKEYVNYLKFFDLLNFDFTGFDVSNLDFTDTNAFINQQTVYNKDMSNGNYSDVTFASYDFLGVDITNATFNNDFVICYQESQLKRKLSR